MASSTWLSAATGTYLEGARLERRSPSLAGVAFVAAIEAVGLRVFDVPMCDCGEHRRTTERYRRTVALVANPDDVPVLADDYKVRSKFVHRGVMPGSEPIRGAFPAFDPYASESVERNEHDALPRLGRTARALMERALRGQLPPKAKLEA